ncbi:MAG: FMN-binding protein, partial [Chloroflexi bacterium]|nr:FMN-binding protein [Chloroflexota bacterium]
AILGFAAMLIGMYLIGTARLAPPLRATAVPTPTPRPMVASPSGTAVPQATTAPVPDVVAGIAGDVIDTPYGDLQVRVFLSAGRIEDVEMVVKPAAQRRSRQISESVDSRLRKRSLAAQSAHFDVLSGATYTSVAYMRSLETALRAASMEQP